MNTKIIQYASCFILCLAFFVPAQTAIASLDPDLEFEITSVPFEKNELAVVYNWVLYATESSDNEEGPIAHSNQGGRNASLLIPGGKEEMTLAIMATPGLAVAKPWQDRDTTGWDPIAFNVGSDTYTKFNPNPVSSTIPAPGALLLLGLAAGRSRRRRRS